MNGVAIGRGAVMLVALLAVAGAADAQPAAERQQSTVLASQAPRRDSPHPTQAGTLQGAAGIGQALPGPSGERFGGLLLAILSLACLACAAAAVAAWLALSATKRIAAGGDAARAAFAAGGKLFDGAARRFIQAQDDARMAADDANAAAARTAQAASRLAGAAREAEGRMRDCLDEAEARLAAAGGIVRQYEETTAGLPDRLSRAIGGIAGQGASAIDTACAALAAGARSAEQRFDRCVQALPPLLADAAAGGRALPVVEAAAERLAEAGAAMAQAGAGLPGAALALHEAAAAIVEQSTEHWAVLDGTLTRAQDVAGLLPRLAAAMADAAGRMRQPPGEIAPPVVKAAGPVVIAGDAEKAQVAAERSAVMPGSGGDMARMQRQLDELAGAMARREEALGDIGAVLRRIEAAAAGMAASAALQAQTQARVTQAAAAVWASVAPEAVGSREARAIQRGD